MDNDKPEFEPNLFGRPLVKSEFLLKKEEDFNVILSQRRIPTESEIKKAKELFEKEEAELKKNIDNIDPSLLESYMKDVNLNEP